LQALSEICLAHPFELNFHKQGIYLNSMFRYPLSRLYMSTAKYTEAWLSGPLDTNFYTRTYAPPPSTPAKAALVFLHGFAEHVGRYTHFHPLLAERGITVFTYDQRGFGLTAQDTEGKKSKGSAYGKTSWKDQMRDIDWAISHVKESFKGLPVFLMGHSMVSFFEYFKRALIAFSGWRRSVELCGSARSLSNQYLVSLRYYCNEPSYFPSHARSQALEMDWRKAERVSAE
jgi:hypothetical protein